MQMKQQALRMNDPFMSWRLIFWTQKLKCIQIWLVAGHALNMCHVMISLRSTGRQTSQKIKLFSMILGKYHEFASKLPHKTPIKLRLWKKMHDLSMKTAKSTWRTHAVRTQRFIWLISPMLVLMIMLMNSLAQELNDRGSINGCRQPFVQFYNTDWNNERMRDLIWLNFDSNTKKYRG